MGLTSVSFAQQSANANAEADAIVVKPIRLVWNQPLAFGNLTTPTSAATSVMDVNGVNITNAAYYPKNPTNTNTNTISIGNNIYGGDGSPGPCIFTVTGQKNFTFAVTLPSGGAIPVLLDNNTQAATALQLDNLTCCVGGNGGVPGLTGTLSGGTGYQFFAVGGTLHIPASAPSGWYQGTFDVSVMYN